MNNLVPTYSWRSIALITVAVVGICGCTNSSLESREPASRSAETSVQDNHPANPSTLAEANKEVREAHSIGKPGAAVALKNAGPFLFENPGVQELSLVLISPNNAGTMTIDVTADEGAGIISTERHFEFTLQPDGEYRVPLTLNIADEGRFYVHLHTRITTESQTSTRVIAAILQVGEPATKVQKPSSQNSATGSDDVISLPAQETISPR